ncbi:hypothetical protein KC332_g1407 [Hortaea werneckii]|nr:hypothetical protein KC358_g1243 [Hortaea werneckii]KAI6852405.1 hypothetical protein KC350_g935 [Hortaea werneckii]KAI6950268.1 hypothetical protein KC348_g784 [Hortaea werneckii]KAI6981478.1 hypothetical protein KC321_g1187 [Hortaea werneckii]KAI6999311.1 hypothetical protein KC329_g836 [Hortaea werneckii]
MSNEAGRRQSSGAPPAPPLPAPKPFQRARDAAYRFIGYPSRPQSPHDDFDAQRGFPLLGGTARFATLGATQNATVSHKTGLEINTLAINEQGTHALLGGKEIFKTVRIEDGVCAEDVNLRTAIRSNPVQASGGPRQTYSIDIADVAWAKGTSGDFVAAATSSGKIILYDLGHAGVPAAQLHEHFRQVHKVTFNPHRGSLLLSGSQDGTVRLWDIRTVREQAGALQSKRKYSGQSDGVRDVKWSPTEGVDFAFGTDSGWIQCWDIRNLKSAKTRIPAHVLACNVVDWHPDGRHIASAGSDKAVRVWDLSAGQKQKHRWELKTPYPVMNGRWRPACESSMPDDNGARQCTQFATAYDREHPVIHVWDLRRPALPFRAMQPYPSAPTDLLWHSQDLLWTVGREGLLLQTDIQHTRKVIDERCLQSFVINPEGDVNMVTQARKLRRVPKRLRQTPPAPLFKSNTTDLSTGHEASFLSRSWADDTIDNSFLSFVPTFQRTRKSSGATSNLTGRSEMIPLNMVLDHRRTFTPQQVSVVGKLPWGFDSETFKYLARRYSLSFSLPAEVDDSFLRIVQNAFSKNEKLAYKAGLYRLSQAWKMCAFVVQSHLNNRARAQRDGLGGSNAPTKVLRGMTLGEMALKTLAPTPISRPLSPFSHRRLMSDGGSSVATPVEKPRMHSSIMDRMSLPPPQLTEANLKELPRQNPHEDRVIRWAVAENAEIKHGDIRNTLQNQDQHHGTHKALAQENQISETRYSLPDDPANDVEVGKPFALVEMLKELIKHHLKTGDAQTATHLIMLMEPLLPRTNPLPANKIEATVQSYTETYSSLGFLPSEIEAIFDQRLQHTIMAGLQPLQLESILSFYHDQLLSLGMLNEAARLRELSYPVYVAVYEDYQKDHDVHLMCGGCGKPIEAGMAELICEHCKAKQDNCLFCREEKCPFGGGGLWSMCLSCGHSGHAACMRVWFEDPESGSECPAGCECLCVGSERH